MSRQLIIIVSWLLSSTITSLSLQSFSQYWWPPHLRQWLQKSFLCSHVKSQLATQEASSHLSHVSHNCKDSLSWAVLYFEMVWLWWCSTCLEWNFGRGTNQSARAALVEVAEYEWQATPDHHCATSTLATDLVWLIINIRTQSSENTWLLFP